MRFDILTLFPEMFQGVLTESILKRAQAKGLIQVHLHNIRDYAKDKHRTTDDTPFGGGGGMVMKAAPILDALHAIREDDTSAPVLLLSPQGRVFTQKVAAELARYPRLILVCGRYEGVDERVRQIAVHEEISLGDFVLTGGELPAMVIIDAVSRLIEGVLGDENAAAYDSHATGLLEHPHYTRPADLDGWRVPSVLLEGHHGKVAEWRRRESLRRTWERRPDLLAQATLSEEERWLLADFAEASLHNAQDEGLPAPPRRLPRTLAIDGPAGSGKSALSERLAERYGYVFIDTGAFYRAITYVLLKKEIALEDENAVRAALARMRFRIEAQSGGKYRLFVGKRDVTDKLRRRKVEAYVSQVAQMPVVRAALLPIQREVAARGRLILAGRDIGTVVLPDADLKIYLDASVEERARRRYLQMVTEGKNIALDEVKEGLAKRDSIDSGRSVAPLSRAPDAVYISSDGKSLDEVLAEISHLIENWEGSASHPPANEEAD
jgi:tRNA (guanine37-N1)-methyltransferase